MVLLRCEILARADVGIKLVPLLRRLMRSVERVISVKLWILLVEVSFSFSISISSLRCSFSSISKMLARLV